MKGALRLAAVFLLLVAVSACGTDRRACTQPGTYCVGFVTSTARLDDHGLNASTWEGVQTALHDGTIQAADSIESVDARDYIKNLAYFAEHGYDLVISAGQGQTEATRAAAEKYPETHFLGLDETVPDAPLPNLQVVTFAKEQGGFQAGALAALVSQSNIVGAVCETSGIDSMWQYCEGFRLGAQHEKKDITVLVSYHENASPDTLFTDEDWGARTATGMLNKGADVIFGVGGRVGQGALRRAAQAGIWAIGSEQDQYFETREARAFLLASAVPQAADLVRGLLGEYASNGQIPAEVGSMSLSPFHEGERNLPLSAQAELLALKMALENGSLPVHAVKPR